MKTIPLFEEFISLYEATTNGITAYYHAICKEEGIQPIPLRFESVKYGGASTTYNSITNKPLYISFDIHQMRDPEFAILHEITHQIKLETEGNPYLGKKDQSAKFQKLQNKLIDKYMYSSFSKLLYSN